MSPLPDWECRSPAKKRAMEKWVNDQLDKLALDPALLKPSSPEAIADFAAYWKEDKLKRPQGRQLGKHPLTEFLVRDARREIKAVRAIWQKHYGKSSRGPMNRPFAAEIVYRRFLNMGFLVNPKSIGMKAHPTDL